MYKQIEDLKFNESFIMGDDDDNKKYKFLGFVSKDYCTCQDEHSKEHEIYKLLSISVITTC